jgi:hypothetical protein
MTPEILVHMTADISLKSVPCIVWAAPVIILLVASSRMPYGYYALTRILTSGAAVLVAVLGLQERFLLRLWSLPFLAIAIMFNPLVPIQLHRETWFFVDLGTAVIFCAHLIFV